MKFSRKTVIWLAVSLIAATIIIYITIQLVRYFKQRKMDGLEFFTWSEFDATATPAQVADPNVATYMGKNGRHYLTGSGEANMNRESVRRLIATRRDVGIPFIITSGFRTQAYNATISGASSNSAHLRGRAFDIAAPTAAIRKRVAESAVRNGFTRIGFGKSFIHLDDDPSLPQRVTWGYSGNAPEIHRSQLFA